MLAALITLFVLNILDAVGTWYAVGLRHYATEANPIMAAAISVGWWFFFLIKTVVMGGVLWMTNVVWKSVKPNTMPFIVAGLLAMYLFIDAIHVAFFIRNLGGH